MSSSSDSSSDDDDDLGGKENAALNESIEWLEHRRTQPDRLHPELWDNRKGEVNDGPSCR